MNPLPHIRSVAVLIPAKVRSAIYTVLGTAYALELIFDVLPDSVDTKILAALGVLGFGISAANVPRHGDDQRVVRVQRH